LKIKQGLFEEAVDMAEKQNVELSDELAESLIPPASAGEGMKIQITLRVANHLQRTGNFTLACKLFTQGKQKLKAM
jgi:intraflagellar transport protein 140